jgi:hypothetical protein
VPWNDTCTNPIVDASINSSLKSTLTATQICDEIFTGQITSGTDETGLRELVNSIGGGGGVSACTTSDGQTVASCTGGYAKPSWQANVTGIPADGKRDLPDVSFFASNGFLGSAYLICVSANGACTYTATTEPTAQEVGGTSVATPAMAGAMALINQKAGAPQGNPNAELYSLAAKQNYANCSTETVTAGGPCYFNDIDTGTNAMPCDYSDKSPNCTGTNEVGILSGYSATAGFDPATGLGSLNVANVVNGWTAPATSTETATVTVTPTPTSITVSQGLSVAVTVSSTTGTPTGTVTLVGPGYVGTLQALSTGPYTFAIPAYGLSGGTDILVASYSGDANFAEASATATVTVSKLTPTGITVTPSATSIAANVALTVTGTVTGAGPAPTGTVTLTSGGYTSAVTELSSGAYSIAIPASSLSVGTDTLTIAYSGDNNYSTVSGTATVTVTAPAAPATYALSASVPTAVSPGTSATSTVTVTASNGYAGTVALGCSLTSSPTGASDVPTCAATSGSPVTLSTTATTGTATVTVTTTAATSGALVRPDFRRNRTTLASLGVAAFALLALLGIPAQRRSWRAMLGVLVLLAALGSLAACGGGGGGSSGGGGGTSNPGTTAGTYTFTVTGTGNPAVTPAPTTTFTLTVN